MEPAPTSPAADVIAALHACLLESRTRHVALAQRLLRDYHEAEDAVQETALQAFRALHGFRADARLSTWLHRLLVNTCLMRLRHRRTAQRGGGDASTGGTPTAPTDLADHREASPLAVLAQAETSARVAAEVAALPPSLRAVAHFRLVLGSDTKPTAERLQLSVNAVKLRLHRARRKLQAALAPLAA